MCWSMTVAVPLKFASICESLVPERPNFKVQRGLMPSDSLPEGFVAVDVTSGGCGCDLYIPIEQRPAHDEQVRSSERRRDRYRRMGWSEAKIDRAMQDAASARELQPKSEPAGFRPDVRQWLLRCTEATGGIILAYYNPYAGEAPSKRKTIDVAEVSEPICDLWPDTVFEIRGNVRSTLG